MLRRALKKFPFILTITACILAVTAMCAAVMLRPSKSEEKTTKVSIGVVGDTSDTFLNLGIDIVKNIDDSRFYIDIRNLSKDEANKALDDGSIIGYIELPEDFIYGIASMDNVPCVYYLPNRPESLGTVLTKEVIDAVAVYITESQKAVMGLSSYIRTNSLERGNSLDELSLFLITASILQRNKLYTTEHTGIAGHISAGGYYIAGLLLFFILLWSISCSSILICGDYTFRKFLRSKGFGCVRQVLCDYSVYSCLTVVTFLFLALIAGIALGGRSFGIRELEGTNALSFVMYILKILPVILAVTSMQFVMYEMTRGTVSSLLLQFLSAVLFAYLSGCFYPNYFFPGALRSVIDILPPGVGFGYMRDCLTGTAGTSSVAILFTYTVLFLAASAVIRKHRTESDAA